MKKVSWLSPVLCAKVFIIGYTLLYNIQLFSQDTLMSRISGKKYQESARHRISIGGNFAFQVGSVTGITIAPEIAYRVFDNLHVGTRFIYEYFNYKNYFYDSNDQSYLSFSSNTFGGALFSRYYLSGLFSNELGNLFGHIEYEYLSYINPYSLTNGQTSIKGPYGYYIKSNQTIEINSFFVGGGYRQQVGGRVGLDLLILFNLNDNLYSPYTNPIFRFGVGVGL